MELLEETYSWSNARTTPFIGNLDFDSLKFFNGKRYKIFWDKANNSSNLGTSSYVYQSVEVKVLLGQFSTAAFCNINVEACPSQKITLHFSASPLLKSVIVQLLSIKEV